MKIKAVNRRFLAVSGRIRRRSDGRNERPGMFFIIQKSVNLFAQSQYITSTIDDISYCQFLISVKMTFPIFIIGIFLIFYVFVKIIGEKY